MISYRALLHVRDFPRLAVSALLVRSAGAMWQLALVLFVLERFDSPTLAGIAVFLSIAPGILIAPLAGALLDRHGRVRLMVLDYAASAAFVGLLVGVTLAGVLSEGLLLLIALGISLTNPIGQSGGRSLFPLVVPRHLWDRANALDSAFYTVTAVVAMPLAGVLVALFGSEVALGVTAAIFLIAAAVLLGVRDPLGPRPGGSLLHQSWAGVRYVVSHPTLRGLAISISTSNLAHGIVIVALPVLVLDRMGGDAATVGQLWAVAGAAGLVGAVVAGRLGTEGREPTMLSLAMILTAVPPALLLLASLDGASAFLLAAIGMVAIGLIYAMLDVALFSIRQRRTDPAWFGRAFAVSMYLNYSGIPFGSGIGGPLAAISLPLAFGAGIVFALIAGVLGVLLIPRDRPGEAKAA